MGQNNGNAIEISFVITITCKSFMSYVIGLLNVIVIYFSVWKFEMIQLPYAIHSNGQNHEDLTWN